MTAKQKLGEGGEAEIYEWEPGVVLRLLRPSLDAGARLDREAAAIAAASTVGAPVPAVFGRAELDGRAGLLIERVDGPDMLTLVARRPWTLPAMGRLLGSTHAVLHRVSAPPELPVLREKIARLLAEGDGLAAESLGFIRRRLDELEDGAALCHGDFQPANVLIGKRNVVIDWASATRGDPAADVARTIVTLRAGAAPPGAPFAVRRLDRIGRRLLLVGYLRGYGAAGDFDQARVERWMPVRAADRLMVGIPAERDALLRTISMAMSAHA